MNWYRATRLRSWHLCRRQFNRFYSRKLKKTLLRVLWLSMVENIRRCQQRASRDGANEIATSDAEIMYHSIFGNRHLKNLFIYSQCVSCECTMHMQYASGEWNDGHWTQHTKDMCVTTATAPRIRFLCDENSEPASVRLLLLSEWIVWPVSLAISHYRWTMDDAACSAYTYTHCKFKSHIC